MRVSWDPQSAPLRGVSPHLMPRRMSELLSAWQSDFRISFVPADVGQGSLLVDIRKATKAQVYSWLESANVTCVDIHSADIDVLAQGWHQFARFLLQKAADSTDPEIRRCFISLLPDEIDERLREVVVAAETSATPQPIIKDQTPLELQAAIEEDAIAELRKVGLNLGNDFPELPKPQPPSDKHDEAFGIGVFEESEEPVDDDWGVAW